VREKLRELEIENSGPLVFLFDAANRDRIATSGASVLHGFDANSDDHALRALAAEGALVVYELAQDDTVRIAVGVGAPLSAAEKKGRAWRKPQTARLHLPSGRLCVHTYDSLDAALGTPSAKEASLPLPPGDYVLTLQRVDVDAVASMAPGPGEVVTLAPRQEAAKAVRGAILGYDTRPRAPWDGRFSVSKDEFAGVLVKVYGSGSLAVNLNVRAARSMGLVRGEHLELEVAGIRFHAFYHGELNPQQCDAVVEDEYFTASRAAVPDLLRAFMDSASMMDELRGPSGFFRGTRLLRLAPFSKEAGTAFMRARPALSAAAPGTSVYVRRAAQAFAPPPDLSWLGRWRVESGVLHGEVLLSKDSALWLNLDEVALRKLGFALGKGGALELKIGHETRRVYDVSELAAGAVEARMENTHDAAGQRPLSIVFRPHWDVPGTFVASLTPLFFRRYPVGLSATFGTPVELRVVPRA
jgi:hypothetical protein